MEKRIDWIDSIRGMAFIMVIFSHLDFDNNVAMRFIDPIFLTAFFFVSGYLFKTGESFLIVFEQRARTLLIPFVLLGTFNITTAELYSSNTDHIGIAASFAELFSQYGTPHINTMWFIPSLFVYSMFFFFLQRLRNNSLYVWLLLLIVICNWCYLYMFNGIALPYHIQYTGFACFYMAIGKMYRENEQKLNKYLNLNICLVGVVIYVIYICIFDFTCNFYGSPLLIDAITISLIGLTSFLYISKKVTNKYLMYIGANSLLYFAFHGKAMSFVSVFWNKIPKELFCSNIVIYESSLLIKAIIVSIVIIPLCYIVNRYFPFIMGKGYKLYRFS